MYVLFQWFLALRSDSDIKLLKLAERIQAKESTEESKSSQDQLLPFVSKSCFKVTGGNVLS
jgi:hypothetical protein